MKRETEAGFTATVLALAKIRGWHTLHIRPGRTDKGWRTPVQGDGKGFPDLLMLRGSRTIAAELKCGNKATLEQTVWLQKFQLAGAQVFVWTPADWPEIERELA
jgi:hypothetical protein